MRSVNFAADLMFRIRFNEFFRLLGSYRTPAGKPLPTQASKISIFNQTWMPVFSSLLVCNARRDGYKRIQRKKTRVLPHAVP